jgi:hypothetical protein
MKAMVTKVAGVSASFSKSLIRRRFRPNHEKGALTTHHQVGTTKPHMSFDRLTIAMFKQKTERWFWRLILLFIGLVPAHIFHKQSFSRLRDWPSRQA